MKFTLKKAILIFLILLFFLFLNVENLKNKFYSVSPILKIYLSITDNVKKINLIFDKTTENFLISFSKKHQKHWTIENKINREKLPEFKFIENEKKPTLSNGNYEKITNNWYRSHSNHASTRFSELTLINKENLKNLEVAWIFKSGEPGDIQCNPIAVDGIIYTPIAG